jgi:drug/metabolite transporter (DMT)-like permease
VTGELAGGLAAALGAAVLFGTAPVLQASAAARNPTARGVGIALTLRLLRQPVWLAGLGCEIGGFVLEAFALSTAPVTLVAPLTACDLVVFVLLGWPAFRTRLTVTGVGGAVVMAGGVALLAVAFGSSTELGKPADDVQLAAFLGVAAAAAGLATLVGGRALRRGRPWTAAVAFSVASGAAYGLASLATRQIGRTFRADQPWALLGTPAPYVLAGCSVLAIATMQRGLQTRPAITYPISAEVSAFLPVIVGALVLGDGVPTGWRQAMFVAALVLMAGGLALLARDRRTVQDVSERRQEVPNSAANPSRQLR